MSNITDKTHVVEEISNVHRERYRQEVRDEYCHLKAITIHRHLDVFDQLLISPKDLESALKDDWDSREAKYSAPPGGFSSLPISQEDLLLHLLRNPQILQEPELGFLAGLIQLERGIMKGRKEG